MNAKQIMRTIVYIGYIIIYNLIFFMKGGMDSSAAGWIAYGFVWLAILVSYIAPLYCKNYKRIPENLITNYTFSWIYSGSCESDRSCVLDSQSEKCIRKYKGGISKNESGI